MRSPIWLVASVAFLSLSACAPQPPVAVTAERVSADTPRATPAGATFTAPAEWSLTIGNGMAVLAAPEGDSRVALVDVQTADADGAMATAWKRFDPQFSRALRVAVPAAARDGWEARHSYQYETSPNERLGVFGAAWRAGDAWIAILVVASEPTLEKRGAQFSLIFSSLRPKGYERESFAGRPARPLDASRIETLRRFLAEGMEALGIPGVGYSFIDGGRIVAEGGLGVRELGKGAPVDAHTLFIAASNTKALTTLLLAQLVDQKKLGWDQPVTQVYPQFKLGDAETTKQVLVKHLVCACTGLPRQDMEWLMEYATATPASSMALLGTMQPTSKFGELFQYSNLMTAAAGYVGGVILQPRKELGAAYDEAMHRRVFAPLGMNRTTFDFARALRDNHASPHGDTIDNAPAVAGMDPNYSAVHVRPAGGAWTSAHDLARYVQMELARGALPGGKRLVSEENLLARHAPHVMVSEDVTYGMGLFVDRHWGVPVVHHGGSMFGYKSDMMWLPDHGVGAVILTNADNGYTLHDTFLRRLVEVLFDGKPEAGEKLRIAAEQKRIASAKERERIVLPADPAEAAKLAVRYRDRALGGLEVVHRDGNLTFDLGEWRSTMATRRNEDGTISFVTVDPTLVGLEFVAGERGGKRALIVRDAQHEYAFVEVAGH